MGLVEYNFGGIDASSAELHSSVAKTLGLLTEGEAALHRLQAAWQGEGSMSWQAVHTRWDHNANEINEALKSLGLAVGNAGQTMGHTEKGVISSFGG